MSEGFIFSQGFLLFRWWRMVKDLLRVVLLVSCVIIVVGLVCLLRGPRFLKLASPSIITGAAIGLSLSALILYLMNKVNVEGERFTWKNLEESNRQVRENEMRARWDAENITELEGGVAQPILNSIDQQADMSWLVW